MILPSDNKRKGAVTLLATIIFLQINTLQQTCNVICNKIEKKNAFGQPTQTTIYQHISNKIIKTESRFSVIPACSQKKMLQDQPEFGGRKGDPKRGKA